MILASYEADFAATWGRRVRNTIQENAARMRVRVSSDSAAVNMWDTTAGGGMTTAGVGGPITGKGADLLIIDDPIKNFEEANSETYRQKTWDWWQNVAYTRLEPGASVIVTMARWHDDDLVGRLLDQMRKGDGEQWEIVNLPATAEEGDPLGRRVGEALCSERYDETALKRIQKAIGSYAWNSLYQQRPNPQGGGKFKQSWFRYVTDEGDYYVLKTPEGDKRCHKSTVWKFATCDTALSEKETADYTVIAIWGVTTHNDLLLLNIWRDRKEAPDVKVQLKQVPERWGTQFVGIEKAHYGTAYIQELHREGFAIKELIADKDKVTRAMPASVRMESGKVYFLKDAPWQGEYESELLKFPTGSHDDQVDVTAYAAQVVSSHAGKWEESDPLTDDRYSAINSFFG